MSENENQSSSQSHIQQREEENIPFLIPIGRAVFSFQGGSSQTLNFSGKCFLIFCVSFFVSFTVHLFSEFSGTEGVPTPTRLHDTLTTITMLLNQSSLYVSQRELFLNGTADEYIDSLFQQEQPKPTPISQKTFDQLKKHVTDETNVQNGDHCSVCKDAYTLGEKTIQLPCEHLYHPDCIEPWLLKEKNTCPSCRHVLISKEEETEQIKSEPKKSAKPETLEKIELSENVTHKHKQDTESNKRQRSDPDAGRDPKRTRK